MNRYTKYIDFVGQSLCIVTAAAIVLTEALWGWLDDDWIIAILAIQLILGLWQLFSAILSVIALAPFRKLKSIYLVIAVAYIISLPFVFSTVTSRGDINWAIVIATVPAWILAICYYSLTWVLIVRANTRHGGFLPHLGF